MFEHGLNLFGEGRCLLQLGDPGAEAKLRQATDIFIGLGATPFAAEAQSCCG